jgi:hypothetical protein
MNLSAREERRMRTTGKGSGDGLVQVVEGEEACPGAPHLIQRPFGIARSDVDAGHRIGEDRDGEAKTQRIEGRGADAVIRGEATDIEVADTEGGKEVHEGLPGTGKGLEGRVAVPFRIAPLGDYDSPFRQTETGMKGSARGFPYAVGGPGAAVLLKVLRDRRVPVTGGDHGEPRGCEALHGAVEWLHHPVPVGNLKRAGGAKIVLHVND